VEAVIFGDVKYFAIEAEPVKDLPDLDYTKFTRLDIYFQFIIGGVFIGDPIGHINSLVPSAGSAAWMLVFCENKPFRRNDSLRHVSSQEFFAEAHDRYYNDEWGPDYMGKVGNYRDWYHLTAVGVGALLDVYAIVAVDVSETTTRIVVMSYEKEAVIIDCEIPSRIIDEAGAAYVNWVKEGFRA
jgi:hypothetical protein